MPIPLSYQISEFDCGPVCMLNALNVLFDRRKIHPCLIKAIYQFSLDCVDTRGYVGKRGTSGAAVRFVSTWMNDYAKRCNFPIRCTALPQKDICLTPDSPLVQAVQQGAVALVRCRLCVEHYVLITGIRDGWVELWDPYHIENPIRKKTIRMVEDHPYRYNRLVSFSQMNGTGNGYYHLGPIDQRECTLFYNTENETAAPAPTDP